MSKAQTALLEPFQGLPLESIRVPQTDAELQEASRRIMEARVVGFDTESKPTFRAGESSDGPHVVQFALLDCAYVFQLDRPESRACVSALLLSEHLLKIGFGLKGDRSQIQSKLAVVPHAILDLNQVFRKRGYRSHIGVRAAVGAVLNQSFPKSKKTTTSNWAAPRLTPRQLLYAANDAYAALRVMEALDPAELTDSPRRSRKPEKSAVALHGDGPK